MERGDIAWRGFVTREGGVVAWPALMAQHRDFHFTFYTSDEDFAARWRQWSEGGKVDFDAGASDEAKETVERWLNGEVG